MTETNDRKINEKPRNAGLFRRLFAIFYDTFLLTAILFIITAIAMALNHGQAIEAGSRFHFIYMLLILGACYLYFSWLWINGGQTLGMKTWRIKIISSCEQPVNWKTTAIRFAVAMISWGAGTLGFLWALFDKKNRCWHDLISKTELLDLRE